jgi:hypothetical protein
VTPIATVRVVNLDTTSTLSDVTMLVDSGADVSVLPKHVSDAPTPPRSWRSFELTPEDYPHRESGAVVAAVVLMGKPFRGTRRRGGV